MVVHARRAGRARREHVVVDGQGLELHVDRGGDVLRLGARIGEAHRDRLTDEAQLVDGERGLFGDLEARQAGDRADVLHPDEVARLKDLVLVGVRDRQAGQRRVRHRAADERDLLHADQPDVADELALAAHQPIVLEPR